MKHLLYILLWLPMVLVCGCQDAETRERLSREERERARREDSAALKIGVVPTEDCLPIVVASQLRLFDTLGIDVHLRRYKAMSECRQALTIHAVEGAAIDTTLMRVMNSKPVGKDSLAGEWLYGGLKTHLEWKMLTAKRARISRIDQLPDKIIAADSHGDSHRLAENAIDSLLRKGHLVFVIQVEDPRVRMNMLLTGNVDAAMLPEPYATKALRQGVRRLQNEELKRQNGSCGVVAFRKKAMEDKERKHQYEQFVKAVGIAQDSIKQYGKEKYIGLLEW